MKIFWKYLCSVCIIVTVIFSIFGSLLIYKSFFMSLHKEKEQAKQTIQLYQFTFLQSLENFSSDLQSEDYQVTEIAKTVNEGMNTKNLQIGVFNDKKKPLYMSKGFVDENVDFPDEKMKGFQEIRRKNSDYYLQTTTYTGSEKGEYYIVLYQNIDSLYSLREQLYDNYQKFMILILVITIIVAGVTAHQLTRPVIRLQKATRDFAKGDYKSRVKVTGKDEVTDLMNDFNHMAKELEKTIQEIQTSAKRQEEFTGAFAHELKTPLTSIIGYAEALCTMQLTSEEQINSADYIYRQGRRLESLSHKMLQLSEISQEEITLKPISIPVLMQSVKDFTMKLCTDKSIELICKDTQGVVYGDMELLESLFGNLIENAKKASDEGNRIIFSCSQTEQGYEFQVEDYGYGIPQNEIEKIEDAFYRVDKSRSRKEGGVGLGLALCRRIVELHGAHWRIESQEKQGTKITVVFMEREGTKNV